MFFQILHRCQYGFEVDWWSVGRVMYDMMLELYHGEVFVHPIQYTISVIPEAGCIIHNEDGKCKLRH